MGDATVLSGTSEKQLYFRIAMNTNVRKTGVMALLLVMLSSLSAQAPDAGATIDYFVEFLKAFAVFVGATIAVTLALLYTDLGRERCLGRSCMRSLPTTRTRRNLLKISSFPNCAILTIDEAGPHQLHTKVSRLVPTTPSSSETLLGRQPRIGYLRGRTETRVLRRTEA
jgi:hypothetical protein